MKPYFPYTQEPHANWAMQHHASYNYNPAPFSPYGPYQRQVGYVGASYTQNSLLRDLFVGVVAGVIGMYVGRRVLR